MAATRPNNMAIQSLCDSLFKQLARKPNKNANEIKAYELLFQNQRLFDSRNGFNPRTQQQPINQLYDNLNRLIPHHMQNQQSPSTANMLGVLGWLGGGQPAMGRGARIQEPLQIPIQNLNALFAVIGWQGGLPPPVHRARAAQQQRQPQRQPPRAQPPLAQAVNVTANLGNLGVDADAPYQPYRCPITQSLISGAVVKVALNNGVFQYYDAVELRKLAKSDGTIVDPLSRKELNSSHLIDATDEYRNKLIQQLKDDLKNKNIGQAQIDEHVENFKKTNFPEMKPASTPTPTTPTSSRPPGAR